MDRAIGIGTTGGLHARKRRLDAGMRLSGSTTGRTGATARRCDPKSGVVDRS